VRNYFIKKLACYKSIKNQLVCIVLAIKGDKKGDGYLGLCLFNKNALLQTAFLAILPTGLEHSVIYTVLYYTVRETSQSRDPIIASIAVSTAQSRSYASSVP